ncbi:hypothetical protein WGB36_002102, partial [Neisseria gonorrhoeae]
AAEEKRREEKRREEKRRFFAGWIHFRLLIRFNRLKKRFSLMLKGGLYRVPGGVSTHSTAPAARFMRLARSAAGNLPTFPASGGRNGRHTVYKPQYRLQ